MEMSHLKRKLVGCFSPILPQPRQQYDKKKIEISYFPPAQTKTVKRCEKANTLRERERKKIISVNICAHEFSLSGTLIC